MQRKVYWHRKEYHAGFSQLDEIGWYTYVTDEEFEKLLESKEIAQRGDIFVATRSIKSDRDVLDNGKSAENRLFSFIVGLVMSVSGIALSVYGNHLNNDLSAQLNSYYTSGTENPGTIWLIIGIILGIIGIVMVVSNLNKKD